MKSCRAFEPARSGERTRPRVLVATPSSQRTWIGPVFQSSRWRGAIASTRGRVRSPELRLNPREQRYRFPDYMSVRQTTPCRLVEPESLLFPAQLHFPIQLIENSMRR